MKPNWNEWQTATQFFIGDKSVMSKDRFEELRLQDESIICTFCKEEFELQLEDTIGGGYGVIGILCPKCGRLFGLERGGA